MIKAKFPDWHKHHGCSKEELWKIQNCLGVILGWEHPEYEAAKEAWKAAPESNVDLILSLLPEIKPIQEKKTHHVLIEHEGWNIINCTYYFLLVVLIILTIMAFIVSIMQMMDLWLKH